MDQSSTGSGQASDTHALQATALRETLLDVLRNQRVLLAKRAREAVLFLDNNPEERERLEQRLMAFFGPLPRPIIDDLLLYPPRLISVYGSIYLYPWPYSIYSHYYPHLFDRDEALSLLRRETAYILGYSEEGSLKPYVNYLVELIRTLELEDLIEPYI